MVAMKEAHPHCWKSPVTSVTRGPKVNSWRSTVTAKCGKAERKKPGKRTRKSRTRGGNLSRWHSTEQHSCLNISAAPCLSVPRLKKGEERKKKKWQVRPEASTYHCSPPAKSPGGRGEAADSSSRLLFFGLKVSSTPTKPAVSLLLLPLGPHLLLLFTYMTSAVGGAPGEHTLRPIYVPKFKAQARVERERVLV